MLVLSVFLHAPSGVRTMTSKLQVVRSKHQAHLQLPRSTTRQTLGVSCTPRGYFEHNVAIADLVTRMPPACSDCFHASLSREHFGIHSRSLRADWFRQREPNDSTSPSIRSRSNIAIWSIFSTSSRSFFSLSVLRGAGEPQSLPSLGAINPLVESPEPPQKFRGPDAHARPSETPHPSSLWRISLRYPPSAR